jgi:autotransporter-associated beta strand protein
VKIPRTDPTFARDSMRAPMKSIGVCAGAFLGTTMAWAQPDYAAAHWSPPGCVKYYTSGFTRSFCVIHDMEGYYLDSISYLNRCDTSAGGTYNVDASVYYCVNGLQNGSDNVGHAENHPNDPVAGDITQSVRESNWAWHARCWNKYMFGTEHEGFVTTPVWYSEAMYQASAGLQRHLCDTYSIPKDRNHIIGHNEWQNTTWKIWMTNNYPAIDPTCNTHTDPGQYWNWSHFIALINGTSNPGGPYWDMNGPTLGAGTAPSGTWDTTSTNWTADPNGGIGTGPWGGTNAIFSAGYSATGSYAITVAATQTVNNLLVQYGTATFTGGQFSFKGTGTYYSNYVAAGCTAIFNTPFVGTGSPDKWGPGTAVYSGANTSGGYYTLNEGTLGLGNDAALSTARLEVGDQTGANVVTLKSADATAHTLPNYLTLKATNINIGPGGNLTFTGPINVNSNASPARIIAVSNSVTTFSGVLTNTGGLTKTGPGTLVLSGTSANTYGSINANGNTTVSGGTLQLSKTAGVAAVPNGSLIINAGGTLLLGAANQIGDSMEMVLGGGTFRTGGFSEQLGTLKLTANSVIDLGAGASVLKFAASTGVSWSATALTITNWTGSVKGGGADQLLFGANSSSLTAGQVSLVRFANPAGFPVGTWSAAILSTGEVVPFTAAPGITSQPADQIALVGNTVSFTVAANGTPAPAYQWQFNATNLTGATTSALLLTNVTISQSGSYSVSVTNLAGVTNSRMAVLSVYATAAPMLSGVGRLANGQFQFSLTGVPGYDYAVSGSTNLSDWTPLQTNVSPFTFTDTNTGNYPSRFYRAQWVP